MAAVASHLRFQTTHLRHTDRAQRAQRRPTTRLPLTMAAHLLQALLAILHQPTVAALLFLLRPPPPSPLQPRPSALRTATRTTPTQTAQPTQSTAVKTSPVRPSTLRTAARPAPTPSSRAWLSATSTPLVLRLPRTAQAVTCSARLPQPLVVLVLWLRTRCLDLRRLFRRLLFAPIKSQRTRQCGLRLLTRRVLRTRCVQLGLRTRMDL
jgi:hypothetical protein